MVSFKMFAGTNIGLRENNEDNFTVCPDLTKNDWIVPADNQQVIQLGKRGCVMVVADGMGGQNAGEVASAIAIETVKDMFLPNHLPADVLDEPNTIKSFLKDVISECDVRIKKRAEEDPSAYGMGSTIVIAWLIGYKLYIAWLGDSRAYSLVKGKGIARLSKDHSYVQQLVDSGAITDDEAMNHPNSNIITRSLGDISQKAKADVAEYDIEDGQVVLLCSDGLCGVCRDEEIGGIIEDECTDLQKCKECLTTAALAAGGSDNITISLMQILVDPTTSSPAVCKEESKFEKNRITSFVAMFLGGALLLSLIYVGCTILFPEKKTPEYKLEFSVDNDTISTEKGTKYHVVLTGDDDASYDMCYDKTLLTINKNNCTIEAKVNKDTTISIEVFCKQQPVVKDSIKLIIKCAKTLQYLDIDDIISEKKIMPDHKNDTSPTKALESDSLYPSDAPPPPLTSKNGEIGKNKNNQLKIR